MLKMDIMIPFCTIENEPSLLRATIKANLIARAASIYRVNNIILYNSRIDENECRREKKILKLLLKYFVSPPYLKRKLLGARKELKYVGLTYPLQIQTHTVNKQPKAGELRAGLVLKVKGHLALLDIGTGTPAFVEIGGKKLHHGDVVYVIVEDINPLKIKINDNPTEYVGYSIQETNDILNFLKKKRGEKLVIGTSRLGKPFWEEAKYIKELILKRNKEVLLVFGEPYRGIYEIFKDMGANIDEYFDGIYNFIEAQGTKTVRLEEAIFIVMSSMQLIENLQLN